MSHNSPESSPHPPSMENDSHQDAHVHGLRLVLGSILAPKRPSPPSHSGSHPASGTASPFHHWHHQGPVTGSISATEHDMPPLASSPPHGSPVVPHHYQQPYQHAHQQSTPSMHSHLNLHYHHAHHVHPQSQPQPQPHQPHPHALGSGPKRLSFTHSTGSSTPTPSESLSPSPVPSPRIVTPPPTLDHAPHPYPQESAVSDPPPIKTAAAANADAADAKRAHFLRALQSKSAWDAMIHVVLELPVPYISSLSASFLARLPFRTETLDNTSAIRGMHAAMRSEMAWEVRRMK